VSRVVRKKALGQHFLADRNVLGVIGRLAGLDRRDVVLEVGPGLGVLTAYLADRVSRVHAIELDRALEFGDALAVDLAGLDPAPEKLVSNLPYSIATPLVVESLTGAPSIVSWCVMVQREVAERFFAVPGTKAYGAVSVLVRLHTRRTGFHPVSRTVFRPPPNVDSALVAFERVPAPPRPDALRRVVTGAFAHRRKTLANSLALAGVAPRERTLEALRELGVSESVRAEALPPDRYVELTEDLAG
jgi:16S rRNA (adenine1518-N6/adenine1519-N6)-dimethyltransferase